MYVMMMILCAESWYYKVY